MGHPSFGTMLFELDFNRRVKFKASKPFIRSHAKVKLLLHK